MDSQSVLTWEKARKIADAVVFKKTAKHLSDLEVRVLEGSWDGKSYEDMAEEYGYSADTIRGEIGFKLWRKLTEALEEGVTKKNFKEPLRREWEKQQQQGISAHSPSVPPPEPQNVFYVERPPIEENCYRAIAQPGELIRIKAPQKMGKSLLMNRIFTYAVRQKQYQTAYFDLLEPEEDIIADLDELLAYFCSTVSLDLGLADQVEQYWDKKRAKTLKCRTYFDEYILKNLKTPLVLGLDNVDRLFQTKFHSIASDFFGMLRAWWGKGQRQEKWQKLRFVIVYATESLPNFGPYQSPFNVGKEIKLPDFQAQQIEELAGKYSLDWQADYTKQLMTMINGHPHLVHKTMEHLKNNPDVSLEAILQKAPTNEGIYAKHLEYYWRTLKEDQELAQEFQNIIFADKPISLTDLKQLSQLESRGLIRQLEDKVEPRCQLYRLYFRNHLWFSD